ncbi:hypothetical protein VTN49DRAFT_6128 [Thermomyces lanuginosus]|uniref:uncharacterized protein n=1 Tax=Thermomyces lanuginosus TaxID=5541 RepID=UPI003742A624
MNRQAEVPSAAQPLVPFLKPRQELRRIRQALTLYLQSHIVRADDAPNASSHLLSCVPIDGITEVKRPVDVPGVRKDYLTALREHVAARRAYHELSDTIAQTESRPTSQLEQNKSQDSLILSEYLALLRERRRYERLRLFDRYLKELKNGDPSALPEAEAATTQSLDNLGENSRSSRSENAQERIRELLTQLEEAVIKAKRRLDREQKLLDEVKTQRLQETTKSSVDATSRAVALQRTRDELVQWVEDHLANASSEEDGIEQVSSALTGPSVQLVEERKAEIQEQYASYIRARQALLDALALSQPSPSSEPPAEVRPSQPVVQSQAATESGLERADLVKLATAALFPGSKIQKSLALQRSYLSGLLGKERTNLLNALDRLAHESHLLPEYPLLSRQQKFKHISSTPGSRDRSAEKSVDEIVDRARAWAFASNAARSHDDEYVDQRIELATELAQSTNETLQSVYGLLKQDYSAEKAQDPDPDESDIWAADVRSTRRRRAATQRTGPWSDLDGGIGVTTND